MFMYRFPSIIWVAIIFLGCDEAEMTFLCCLKMSWTDPQYAYVLSVPPEKFHVLLAVAQ